MSERLRRVTIALIVAVSLGIGYSLFYIKTGVGVPCLFYKITGLYCPGCGITRVITYSLQGEFILAMKYNHALFFTLPLLLLFFLVLLVKYIKTGSRKLTIPQTLFLYVIIILLYGYALVKNFLMIFLKQTDFIEFL